MITRPFPFNAFYDVDDVPEVDAGTYRLQVGDLVKGKRIWTLDELHALPQQDQTTRHICIEGWSAIGRWGGVRFAEFLKRVGTDTTACFVSLHCAGNYWTSVDMPTALHAQTLLTLTYDGQVLPPKYGFPIKLRMLTKLGYKSEAYHCDHRNEQISRRLLGEPGLQLVRRILNGALLSNWRVCIPGFWVGRPDASA